MENSANLSVSEGNGCGKPPDENGNREAMSRLIPCGFLSGGRGGCRWSMLAIIVVVLPSSPGTGSGKTSFYMVLGCVQGSLVFKLIVSRQPKAGCCDSLLKVSWAKCTMNRLAQCKHWCLFRILKLYLGRQPLGRSHAQDDLICRSVLMPANSDVNPKPSREPAAGRYQAVLSK